MPHLTLTIETETTRLEHIVSSKVLGICYIRDGVLVQEFDDDPTLPEVIIEHFQDRLRQLRLSEQRIAAQTNPVAYPLQVD